MSQGSEPIRGQPLAEGLRRRLSELTGRPWDPVGLVPVVEAVAERALGAWPDFQVDFGAFLDHLAAQIPPDAAEIAQAVASLAIEDLYLAFACAAHDARALAAFDRVYADELTKATARLRGKADHEDARQRVWQKLFVSSDDASRPKILDYSGRGQLRHWYRVAIVRALLDQLRQPEDRDVALDEDRVLGVPSPAVDPETEYLKRLYRKEFQIAFELAVHALVPEDRNVLRSYYVNRLTIDQIAMIFGIHRATAARRVERARETLLQETRKQLGAQLRLSRNELESVIRLIESQLHVSIGRLLG